MQYLLRTAVAILIAAVIAGAASGAEAGPQPGGTYVDDDFTPHEGSIEAISAAGITKGCSPTHFCPEDPVTRGQMAAFLTRALNLPPTTEAPFVDTQSVFEDSINRLAAAGITKGCSPTHFCPEDPVTRGELATFLTRAIGLDTPSVYHPEPVLASPDNRTWQLIFADEFSEQALDSAKWTTCYW